MKTKGLTSIAIIIIALILLGIVALGGYLLLKPSKNIFKHPVKHIFQPLVKNRQKGYCGDGICQQVEIDNKVCLQDCETAGNKTENNQFINNQTEITGRTCTNLDGEVCSFSESCSGQWLNASDAGKCCSNSCIASEANNSEYTIDAFGNDLKLTSNSAISSLSYNNAHNLVFKNGVLHLVFSDSKDGNPEIYYKSSHDYGATWSADKRLTNDLGISWFPSLAVSTDSSKIYVVWNDNRDGFQEIYYKYSLDAGETWSTDVKLSNSSIKAWYPDIALDRDNVYVAWQDQRDGQGEIYFRRSSNGGNTFGPEQRITSSSGESERPSLGIDSNNNLHLVWYDWRDGNPEVYYSRSEDLGWSWGEQKRITSTPDDTGLPAIEIDDKGWIHVAFLDGQKESQMYLYYISSSDNGDSWSKPIKLSTLGDSWFPTISYSTDLGLYIAWQDTVDNDKEIYYIKSKDNGGTWSSPYRLTSKPGDSLTPFIASDDKGGIHIVWEDNMDGNREIYYKNNLNNTSEDSGSGSLKWSNAVNFGQEVNTADTEKAPAISPDGKELYFFREAVGGKFDIYVSDFDGSSWSAPTNSGKVSAINLGSSNEVGPFISRDGLKLYFASDRSGGYGSYDIYYSTRESLIDEWGTPINMGNIINSNESELGPTLNANETLIFLARGWPPGPDENLYYSEKKNSQWTTPVYWEHNTPQIEDNPELSSDGTTLYLSVRDDSGGNYYADIYGDFDIYVSDYKNGAWEKPVNIGPEINTQYHDANAAISADGKTLYFSSKGRSDGYGNFDVYFSTSA